MHILGNQEFHSGIDKLLEAAKGVPEDAADGKLDQSLGPLIMAALSLFLVIAQAYAATTRNPFDDWIVGALRTFLPGLERTVNEALE